MRLLPAAISAAAITDCHTLIIFADIVFIIDYAAAILH